MRILPDCKCIYIHIPKTAGNSIAEALDTLPATNIFDLPDTGLWEPDIEIPDVHRPKHIKANELRNAIGEEVWNSYFTFAFVRNPWDLMVSSYNWWLQKASKWEGHRETVAEICAMHEFTGFMASPYGSKLINEFEGNIFDWITDGSGEVILDFVARFEQLEDDWNEVCDRLGIDRIPLPHQNRSDRKHYRDYYTDQTRNQIADRFSWSINHFGYEF